MRSLQGPTDETYLDSRKSSVTVVEVLGVAEAGRSPVVSTDHSEDTPAENMGDAVPAHGFDNTLLDQVAEGTTAIEKGTPLDCKDR